MAIRIRRWIFGASVVAIAATGAGLWFVGVPVLAVGTAYKAKTVCSEVFVAGRAVNDVITGLEIDDLRALAAISTTVNEQERVVSARSLGLLERRARFRGGLGCALHGGERWLAPQSHAVVPDVAPDSTSMILSRLLREALGDDAYWALPRQKLFAPLGMTHAVIEADARGTFVASSWRSHGRLRLPRRAASTVLTSGSARLASTQDRRLACRPTSFRPWGTKRSSSRSFPRAMW